MNRFDEMAERNRQWKPPAELSTPGPREVEMTSSGLTLFILAFVFIAGGIAAAILIWRSASDNRAFLRRLADQGATSEALITRLYRGSGDSSDRFVAYQFEYGGAIYRSSSRVPRAIWRNLKEGQQLAVRFVPTDPARSRPVDWGSSGPPHWLAFLAAALLITPAGIFFQVLRGSQRLLAEGRPAPATVLNQSRHKHGTQLKYEFPLLNGSIAAGKCDSTSPAAAVGDTITIIYDRDNPKRNACYPTQLYRVRGAPRVTGSSAA